MDGTLALKKYKLVERVKALEEASGGTLPDYSTTEHKTGQKWIDGKDIYERTYILRENNIDKYTSTASLFDIGLTGVDIVMIKDFFSDRGTQPYVDSLPASSEIIVSFKKDVGGIYFYDQHAPRNIYVTLQYTKASETKKKK